ncbi:MAG: TRAP transporter substrate-binding protein DctP [Acidobacteriota bacterium]|nr:TRAP transporter substrate-binding protein DctP [Acidobacteriota bacterium]
MRSRAWVIAVALMLAPVVLFAQRGTRIQLGSALPANSVWDRSLKEMAVEWRDETDGRVQLRVQSGAFRDEAALARRLKRGRPQAAVFGLPGDIHEAFNVLTIPFFFESDEEVFHVVEKLTPTFERVLADEGLVLLNWGHAGWAHFFTENRVETLDQLKQTKLYTAAGDDKMLQWYKENGFDPAPLAYSDVLLGLNTGLINAHPSPPYVALLFQWYDKTPFMLDVPLAPVLGITVVAERTWSRIDESDQAVLRTSAKRLEQGLLQDVLAQERDSIEQMKQRGLTVVEFDDATKASFRAVADELTVSWRGNMIPASVYDQAVRERNAFRAVN